MATEGKSSDRRPVRERLLAAADDLFYEGGIHSVGIERVLDRAGVAKASLYDTFGSKEGLIRAYLQARDEARRARVQAWLARYPTPEGKILGVFDAAAEAMQEPRYRGCAFVRAAAESRPPAGVKEVCDDARHWMRGLFADLARQAGARDPQALAGQLLVLYDGAAASALMDGGPAAAYAARASAQVLLQAATAP